MAMLNNQMVSIQDPPQLPRTYYISSVFIIQ